MSRSELPARAGRITETPDKRNYLSWLLSAGQECGAIGQEEVARLYNAMGELFRHELTRAVGGESASICSEHAERIVGSVIFSLSVALKARETADIALEDLRTLSPQELLREGRGMVRTRIARAGRYCDIMRRTAIPTKNIAYLQTIRHGFDRFFAAYEPEYSARETPCDIDYPLAAGGPELDGIDYAETYLAAMCHENRFCLHFGADTLEQVMYRYCKTYENLLTNLFLRALITSLGSMLSGGDGRTLPDAAALGRIIFALEGKSDAAIHAVLGEQLERLASLWEIPPGSYLAYLEEALMPASMEIYASVTMGAEPPARIFGVYSD